MGLARVGCPMRFAEELVLEEGAFSAPDGEVLDSLHLVHALAGVPKLGPTREVVAS